MLILLSPSKTLNLDPAGLTDFSLPQAPKQTAQLVGRLKEMSQPQISALMKLSENLADLNHQRYQSFQPTASPHNAKQALLAFKGDVYRDWPLAEYTGDDFAFAQDHLRILSGLYGLLRPLDLIQPYRLEMGTKLSGAWGKNLYDFWADRISKSLDADLETQAPDGQPRFIVNLASNEYFKAVDKRALSPKTRVISPVFKDYKAGVYKTIALFAKRARGAMAHHLIARRATIPADILTFNRGGYAHDPASSTEDRPVFTRRQ